jgi:hypothetical protein
MEQRVSKFLRTKFDYEASLCFRLFTDQGISGSKAEDWAVQCGFNLSENLGDMAKGFYKFLKKLISGKKNSKQSTQINGLA